MMGTSSDSKKTFAIISVIDEEGAVEVIPTMWILNSSHAKWPNIISPNIVNKFIKECEPASEKWRTIKIKIYGYSNSFKNAKYKANVVQTTLNMNSDSSEEEELRVSQRKRKRPARFETNDYLLFSDIESTENNKPRNIQSKRKVTPDFQRSESLEIESSESEDRKTSPEKQRKFADLETNDDSPYVPEEESSDNEDTSSMPIKRKKQSNIQTSDDSSNVSEKETTGKKSSIPKFSEGTSEPSWEQILNESFTDNNSQFAKFSSFFKYLDLLHGQLNELNTKCETISSQVEDITKSVRKEISMPYFSPPDLQLPVDSDEGLIELNEKLKNKDLCKSLACYLFESSCGRSMSTFILSMTKKVLTQKLALTYSRFGRRGKKSFSDYAEISNAVLAAAQLKFQHVGKQDIAAEFGKALVKASDWHRRCKFT